MSSCSTSSSTRVPATFLLLDVDFVLRFPPFHVDVSCWLCAKNDLPYKIKNNMLTKAVEVHKFHIPIDSLIDDGICVLFP